MKYSVLAALVLLAVSALFALTRQFQMLQQNSYFPSRYFGWLKENFCAQAIAEAVLAAGICVLVWAAPLYLAVGAAFLLGFRIARAVSQQKKSIKKLAVTARIKRLYAAAAVLYAVIIAAAVLPWIGKNVFLTVGVLLTCLLPGTALLCRTLMAPVENAIARWYVNDAKRILKDRPDLLVIGVTGSYGKTSVKFILSRILSEKYNVLATPGSFNTPMGVVRTVREHLLPQTQVFICEMGAKNVGDIQEICEIAHPKIGIITSVGAQHLETFRTVDAVFKTKFELADEVLKNGGEVFVNGDSEELFSRIDASRYTVYGLREDADCRVRNLQIGKDGSSFLLCRDGLELPLSTKLLGKHNTVNIAGAAALALKLGVKPDDIRYAVASLKPTEHRLELKPYLNGSVMIDDAYNANPEGCLEAVRVLASFEGLRKVIITPGLIELGEREYECNYRLGQAAGEACDVIILVGKNRSKPLAEGVRSTAFPEENLHIVSGFREAVGIYAGMADAATAVLLENDLPDNYLY